MSAVSRGSGPAVHNRPFELRNGSVASISVHSSREGTGQDERSTPRAIEP